MLEQGSCTTLFEYEPGNDNSARDIVSAAANQNGCINTLIICLEEGFKGDLDDISDLPKFIDSMMNINYYSAVNFTVSAIPHLRKVRGKIVVLVGDDGNSPIMSASRNALMG